MARKMTHVSLKDKLWLMGWIERNMVIDEGVFTPDEKHVQCWRYAKGYQYSDRDATHEPEVVRRLGFVCSHHNIRGVRDAQDPPRIIAKASWRAAIFAKQQHPSIDLLADLEAKILALGMRVASLEGQVAQLKTARPYGPNALPGQGGHSHD